MSSIDDMLFIIWTGAIGFISSLFNDWFLRLLFCAYGFTISYGILCYIKDKEKTK